MLQDREQRASRRDLQKILNGDVPPPSYEEQKRLAREREEDTSAEE